MLYLKLKDSILRFEELLFEVRVFSGVLLQETQIEFQPIQEIFFALQLGLQLFYGFIEISDRLNITLRFLLHCTPHA